MEFDALRNGHFDYMIVVWNSANRKILFCWRDEKFMLFQVSFEDIESRIAICTGNVTCSGRSTPHDMLMFYAVGL